MIEPNNLPRAIMLVDDFKANSLKYEKAYKFSQDVSILGIKEAKVLNLSIPSGLNKNEIFILNPFQNGVYLPIDTDKLLLQKFKINSLFQLAKYLGASRFIASLIYHTVETSKKEGGVGMTTLKVDGEASFNNSNDKSLEMALNMDRTVRKSESVEYAKAIEYASMHGLTNDVSILQFIESRNPEDESVLIKDSFTITTSTEINKSLDCALELNGLANAFKLKTKYSSNHFVKETTTLKIDIEF